LHLSFDLDKRKLICEIPMKIPINPFSDNPKNPDEIISLLMKKMVLNNGGKIK
jgi:hypothetical protein